MSLESFENARQAEIASAGTWSIKPDVLNEYLVGQGLTADQAQGILIIEGDPLGTAQATVPPLPENILGTIWVNPQKAGENYLAKRYNEFKKGVHAGKEVELFAERQVNLAVLEAAQFAARVANGEKMDPRPSKFRLAANATTGAAAVALAAAVYNPTGMDAFDKVVPASFVKHILNSTGKVVDKIEVNKNLKKRDAYQDVPRFVELTPTVSGLDHYVHEFQKPNALATYIGGNPQEVIRRNKLKKRATEFVEKDHPIREFTGTLANNLGLESDRDIILVSEYLAIRGVRCDIYDEAFMQRMLTGKLFAEYRKKSLESKRLSLSKIEQSVEKIIGEEYITDEEKRYARTIGLAVGDLIVRSSDSSGIETNVHITPEILREWSDRWRPQFEKS